MPRETRVFDRSNQPIAAFCYATGKGNGVKCHSGQFHPEDTVRDHPSLTDHQNRAVAVLNHLG